MLLCTLFYRFGYIHEICVPEFAIPYALATFQFFAVNAAIVSAVKTL